MCDLALIKLAIHKAAQGKTRKHYIAKVLANEEKYALRIQKMLLDNEVQLSPNRTIEIYDRSCMKQRLITVPKFFPDQILHWVLMLVIEPILMKGMYRFACGSVPGRGGMEAKKYVERALRDDKVRYVAKLDISKFFNSVKPAILIGMLRRKIKDERVIDLIGKILKNGGDCLPIGYYTSQWFSNFFLEGFDHIEKYLNGIGLKLKPNYQVWKVHSRPIDFVGFRFYKDKTLLRKKIFFRLCRRVRKIEKTGYITVNQARGLLSLLGWLTHINGCGFYKEHIYGIAPRNKLKKIVSNHGKKEAKNGKNKGFQQRAVAC